MTVAYQLEEAGTRLSRTTIERRPLGPRDVRLDLKFCGICHSDLSMLNNDWGMSAYPFVPGHEVIGTVAAVGPAAKRVKVGDTVELIALKKRATFTSSGAPPLTIKRSLPPRRCLNSLKR